MPELDQTQLACTTLKVCANLSDNRARPWCGSPEPTHRAATGIEGRTPRRVTRLMLTNPLSQRLGSARRP